MSELGRHILSIDGLDVSYGGARAVRGVSFDVAPGEVLGIVGESGSGKSTVLRAVADLLPRSAEAYGSIVFDGMDLLEMAAGQRARLRGHRISYAFQDPVQSLDPLFKVRRQFDECLVAHAAAHSHCGGQVRGDFLETERALLVDMGFADPDRVLASHPHQLSGGECQRVVLAMAVACETTLLLADEPTSALDVTSQQQVMALLSRIRDERGTSIVVVSHNIAATALVADRIGVMKSGELVELGACEQVLHAPAHPYTRALIAAVPRADGSLPLVLDTEGGAGDAA